MKITEVKAYPVWVGHRNQCLVKIETDEGVYGWGEAGLSGRELAVAGAVQHYVVPCGKKCIAASISREVALLQLRFLP